ncbi:MAG: hypothetical protein WEA11_01340 [Acidimicrobiales bacterium]
MESRTAQKVVAFLAVVAAILSLFIGHAFFENLSLNNDEAVYVLNAQMFQQGNLSLSASEHGDAFRPWMSGSVGDDRLVLVPQPTLPALMALSDTLFGTMRIALAAIAAAAVLSIYALTNALLRNPRIGVVAAGCFVLSPLFIVKSAMFVSYVLAVTLAATSLAFATRGIDRRTAGRPYRSWIVAAGLFEGLLLWTRPLEGIVLAVILFLWCLLRSPSLRVGLQTVAVIGLLSIPAVVGALVYNALTTGDPFTFALWTLGGNGSFGFGYRAITESSKYVYVGVSEAWLALRVNLRAFPHWIWGGVVSVPIAAWGAWKLWHSARDVFWLLAAQSVLYPLVYFFYYGNYLIIGGRNFYGPHYYLGLLIPAMIFLAVALCDIAKRNRVLLSGVLLAMLLGVAIEVPDKVRVNSEARDAIAREVDLIDATVNGPSIVLIPVGIDGPYILHPWGALSNPPRLDSERLFAVDLGSRNVELFSRFPERRFYRFDIMQTPRGPEPFVQPLTPIVAERLTVSVQAPLITAVIFGDQRSECTMNSTSVSVTLTPTEMTMNGCTEAQSVTSQRVETLRFVTRSGSQTVEALFTIGRLNPAQASAEAVPLLAMFSSPNLVQLQPDQSSEVMAPSAAPWLTSQVESN